MHAVSALIPSPPIEDVIIDASFIHQDVLCKLRRVVVEKIAEGVHGLGDG